jgi:hypothetical protein
MRTRGSTVPNIWAVNTERRRDTTIYAGYLVGEYLEQYHREVAFRRRMDMNNLIRVIIGYKRPEDA